MDKQVGSWTLSEGTLSVINLETFNIVYYNVLDNIARDLHRYLTHELRLIKID